MLRKPLNKRIARRDMLQLIATIVGQFFRTVSESGFEIYNESELQHELGCLLRKELPPGWRVRFELPAGSFIPSIPRLTKKEIDLVVTDGSQYYAVELKCPRQGRHPETMFDICKDLAFLEELIEVGFRGGLFVIHVEDALFYDRGSTDGIYAYFRSGKSLTGIVSKPTGQSTSAVNLRGSYDVRWQECGQHARYWIQLVSNLPLGSDPKSL